MSERLARTRAILTGTALSVALLVSQPFNVRAECSGSVECGEVAASPMEALGSVFLFAIVVSFATVLAITESRRR